MKRPARLEENAEKCKSLVKLHSNNAMLGLGVTESRYDAEPTSEERGGRVSY
jgi:hypothetical protein